MNEEHRKLNLAIFKALNPKIEVEWYWCYRHTGEWLVYVGHTNEKKPPSSNCTLLPCCCIRVWRVIPDPAGDWAAMGALIEEMNERGYMLGEAKQHPDGDLWYASFMRFGFAQSPHAPHAPTLKHAVALATKQALEEATSDE